MRFQQGEGPSRGLFRHCETSRRFVDSSTADYCRRGFCKAMLTSFLNRMEENCDTVTLHSAAGLININTECHLDLLPHLTITSFHKCITCNFVMNADFKMIKMDISNDLFITVKSYTGTRLSFAHFFIILMMFST